MDDATAAGLRALGVAIVSASDDPAATHAVGAKMMNAPDRVACRMTHMLGAAILEAHSGSALPPIKPAAAAAAVAALFDSPTQSKGPGQ